MTSLPACSRAIRTVASNSGRNSSWPEKPPSPFGKMTPFLITTIDHKVAASYKGALDELREQVIDLCDEYEHEDNCLSVKDFIASLRRIST